MAEHREIQIEILPDGEHFVISKQTHRCDEFTPTGNVFTSSDGFRIVSSLFPSSSYDNGMAMRGADKSRDENHMRIPSNGWLKKLQKALDEYNSEFSGEIDFGY